MILGARVLGTLGEVGLEANDGFSQQAIGWFHPGQLVALRSDPSVKGAVVRAEGSGPAERIQVFHDGTIHSYYSSQLTLVEEDSGVTEAVTPDRLRAHLTASLLCHPGLSALYSLHAARIDFIPYQFRPVLKFIRADRPRILVADEVGVGKTIEAGLILKELQARRDLESVMVICPKALVSEEKWEQELKRFDEHFVPLDGSTLNHCLKETDLEGAWPDRYRKAILPFSLFDEKRLFGVQGRRGRLPGLLELDPAPRFDLVIVDEAHHLRNTDTFIHQGIRQICQHAEAVVFLTATPIQLADTDLYVLLNLLRPDLIPDQESFKRMAAPNPYLNRAITSARRGESGWREQAAQALEEAVRTDWGAAAIRPAPGFRRAQDLLSAEHSREARVAFVREAEELHTFGHLINRTRRRDIEKFTTRKPETIEVGFTEAQRELYDRLLEVRAGILSRLHGDQNVRFMMTTLCRQAASCLFALAPFVEGILNRGLDEILGPDSGTEMPDGAEVAVDLISDIQQVVSLAEGLEPSDPKLEALLEIVRGKQDLSNNKVLVFSSFLHSLRYLCAALEREGVRVGLVTGSVPDADRQLLRRRFSLPPEEPDAVDVLLSSEVGCEGLDYQFCDCMVNYDLPWNPARIEQRIGRLDRYGQKSDAVLIYNLVTPDTVDHDVYHRCLWRIGVFQEAIGGSEAVLGDLTSQIRAIAEQVELTEEERRERLEQASDNHIRLLNEQVALEDSQSELFGITLPQTALDAEIAGHDSKYLAPASLKWLVSEYLASLGGEAVLMGDEDRCTLRAPRTVRDQLLANFRAIQEHTSKVHREWEKWLKGSPPHLAMTFSAATAREDRGLVFVTPVHPLVLQSARALDVDRPLSAAFVDRSGRLPPGRHPFALYEWKIRGFRDDVTLRVVAEDSQVASDLLAVLPDCEPAPGPSAGPADLPRSLEVLHHQEWKEERGRHRKDMKRMVEQKLDHLNASHRARIAALTQALASVSDERIRRMRRAQIDGAESDFERRRQEIESSGSRGDILARLLVVGVVSSSRSAQEGADV